MPLHVSPVTESDLCRLVEIQNAAFATHAIDAAMFPDRMDQDKIIREDDPQVQQIRKDMTANPAFRYVKVTDTDAVARDQDGKDSEQGMIVSWAKWEMHLHQRPEAEWTKVEVPEVEEAANSDYVRAFVLALAEHKKRVFGGNPYCYLQILVTHPSQQRRGAASMLMQWGCDIADEAGVPVYVEAEPGGVSFYQRFGLKQVGENVLDLTPFGQPGVFESTVLLLRERSTRHA